MEHGFVNKEPAEDLQSDVLQDRAQPQMSVDEVYALAKHCREEKDYQMEACWYEMLLMSRDLEKEQLITTQYCCGEAYFDAGNEKEALQWFEKAARQGHKKAKLRCGRMYAQSKEEKDQAKALYWLEQAAEEGNPEIQQQCQSPVLVRKSFSMGKRKHIFCPRNDVLHGRRSRDRSYQGI